MTRRRCLTCGTDWLTFGPHDPCPSCGTVQRPEIGLDASPEAAWAQRMDREGIANDPALYELAHEDYHARAGSPVCDLWAVQESLPMA